MTRYFTSDLHISHSFVSEIRGFDSVEEHDAHIKDKWNSAVKDSDEVYILGDLTLLNPNKVRDYVNSLNGTKYLIQGNHDQGHPMHRGHIKKVIQTSDMFAYQSPMGSIRLEGTQVMLSHFPYYGDHTVEQRYYSWRLKDMGKFLLHGHTHSKKKHISPHQLHVGWDAWGEPISEHVITHYIRDWKREYGND